MIARGQLTGLVLAGGRGSRMGGLDKGLQLHRGEPLALQALQRLRPQVGTVMVNANRNRDAYAAFGVPVWPDARSDYPGPLAGMLAGLEHCPTPYLVTVPCDTPSFPLDLAERLAAALADGAADIAMAATREDGTLRPQPVFCLLPTRLAPDLAACLDDGERKIGRWASRHRVATVVFDDAAAFFNANTPAELEQLQARA